MNSFRRRLFHYREAHQRALSEDYDRQSITPQKIPQAPTPIATEQQKMKSTGGSQLLAPSQSAKDRPSTRATTFKQNELSSEKRSLFRGNISEAASSVASEYTQSMKLEILPRPNDNNGKELEEFECPYCFMLVHIMNPHTWK